MNTSGESRPASAPSLQDEDSAVALLQHLNEERGKLFTEADYREMRQVVLDELAHGARIRPFTVFTFGIIAAGLAGLFIVGLTSALKTDAGDYTLAMVSAGAFVATAFFFWNLLGGIRNDAYRSLDARLEELKQLRQHSLVSPDEFADIEAHILIARQRQPNA